MIRTSVRTANKAHRCGDCCRPIKAGDFYLEHVASPGHTDLDNPGWIRMVECSLCAQRYGRWPRDPLLEGAHVG